MRAPLSFPTCLFASRTRRRTRVFQKATFFISHFPHKSQKKKLSLARVPIMFKRLFGQPSSSSSSNRNNNNNNNTMGSTSSGRAAFDAVDKLKDVRIFVLFESVSLSLSFDELDERRLRAFLFSLSLSLFCTRERCLGFEFARASLSFYLSLSLCR